MISIPLIRRELTSDLLGRHIYLFGQGASSAAILRQLAEAGAHEGTVVLSECASRVSAAALFRPGLRLGDIAMFSTIPTLALTEAISSSGLDAIPEWPDQVLVEGERAGSSVIETEPGDTRGGWVILGVDLDIGSLESISRRSIDPNVLVAAFLNALDRWTTKYAARGPAAVRGAIRFLPRAAGARASARPAQALA